MPVRWTLLSTMRSMGLLPYADRVRFLHHRLETLRRNAEFKRANPDFAVPPADLAFDAYNHADWLQYRDVGRRQAAMFADVIRQNFEPKPITVYEWGCGPARLIRHMPKLLADFPASVAGSDHNDRSIAWCVKNIPDIDFRVNDAMPPTSFADEQFDVAYNFSVFTHLSEEAQHNWAAEMFRVLKPNGLLIASTHGARYRNLLTKRDEKARYDAGEVVTQAGYREGRKWFLAIHPEAFVARKLLGNFENVRRIEPSSGIGMPQDLWIARKPPRASQVTSSEQSVLGLRRA